MRSLAISLTLFITVLSAIVLNAVFVTKTAEDMSDIANDIPYSSESTALRRQLAEIWNKRRSTLSLTVKSKSIEDMDDLLISLGASNSHSETERICLLISELCKNISLYETISFHGIF